MRQAGAAEALRAQLQLELATAVEALAAVPPTAQLPPEPDAAETQRTQRAAEQARRAAAIASSSLTALRTRREFLEQQVGKLQGGADAASKIPDAEATLATARTAGPEAESAAISIARLRSQLEGLEALRTAPQTGLLRPPAPPPP